jgi:class 3 adenylate cyclase
LAEGEAAEASRRLKSAIKNWREVKAPYEVAVDRVLLASALRTFGDHDGADLELEAARKTFGDLGAQHDLAAAERLIYSAAARRGEAEQVRKTFMFTDIENSTSLAGAMGNQPWEQLLGWHDETLRLLFSRHAGQVVSTTGDGFFVAFDSARRALDCAIAIQRALVAHRRATGFAPSVRIGLHTDEGTRRGEDYSGQGVHIAARVTALAKGGEIIATAETIAEAGELVTTEAREELLKGVSQPVKVSTISWV